MAGRRNLRKLLVKPGELSPLKLGAVIIALIVLMVAGLSQMEKIRTWTRSGEIVRAEFARNYRLQDYVSEVKVAGVVVGVVESVERANGGKAVARLKVDDGIVETLGSSPRALIRPTTILGGKYYVALEPGGSGDRFSGTIPARRTEVPVELQHVAAALQPDAIDGIRTSVRAMDKTLGPRGRGAVEKVLDHAPGAFGPAAKVLRGLQGERPQRDLRNLVQGLESTAGVLTRNDGELESIIEDMHAVSNVLDDRSEEVAATVRTLPATLDSAERGLQTLDRTLTKLRDTAGPARPVAQELDTTLKHLGPVLTKSRPLVSDLNGLLADARPLVEQLVPTSRQTTSVLNDVSGPVLDRVNGRIKKMVLTPFKGSGVYSGGGSDKPLYQEIGYMFADMDRASQLVDENGTAVGLQPGLGGALISGTPINFEKLLDTIGQSRGGTPEQREGR